ncbi:MAG: hypothetical protein ACRCX8_00165 [Sarcina sp.]
MNRAERRTKEKKQEKTVSKKRLTEWIKGLNKGQQKLISEYADMISNKNFNRLTHSLDLNFYAAMIMKTDLSINDITNVFEATFDLMKEDREKDRENKRKFKDEEGYLEFMKNMEQVVAMRAIELLKTNMKDKEVREKLFLEYPALSKSKITNCVKKVKEDLQIVENVENTTVEGVKENNKKAKGYAIKKEKVLKVKKVELVGKYGTYSIEKKKVKIKLDRTFNKKSWAEYVEEVNAALNLI